MVPWFQFAASDVGFSLELMVFTVKRDMSEPDGIYACNRRGWRGRMARGFVSSTATSFNRQTPRQEGRDVALALNRALDDER